MRNQSTTRSFSYSGHDVNHYLWKKKGIVGTYGLKTTASSRSDFVRNPMVDGWRKPSSYDAIFEQFSYGHYNWDGYVVGYAANGGYSGPIQSNVLGGAVLSVASAELNSLLPSQNVVNETIIRARNVFGKRKGALAESVLEIRSTVQGLASLASTLANFGRAALRKDWLGCARAINLNVKKRKVRRAVRRLELLDKQEAFNRTGTLVSSAWLQFHFGLSPIVSDMMSAMIFLSDEEVHKRLRVKGSARLLTDTNSSGIFPKSNAYGMPSASFSYDTKITSGVYTSLWFTINSEQLRKLAVFGAADIPAAAWAVVPWSFMLDWVLPVSEILKSLTATVGATFKGGSSTSFVKISKRAYNVQVESGSTNITGLTGDGSVEPVHGTLMKRVAYTSEPNPVAFYLKDPFDAWKATTTLALLVTQFSK